MATKKRKPSNQGQKRQKLNTTWLNKAMKSIGAATADTFKDISPTLYAMSSSTAKAAKNISNTVRQNKTNIGKLNKAIAGNKYIQMAKKTIDQSIEDIKSGNLYNNGRGDESMSGFDDFNDSLDDMFGDFDSESSTSVVNVMTDDSQGSAMIADAISSSTTANLKASKASVDAMIALSSTSLQQNLESLGRIESGLSDVNDSINAILQYHEENTSNFYETMIGAAEKLGKTMEDTMSSSGSDIEDLFNSRGGINGSAYKKYVKKNITRVVESSPVGMLLPFLKDDEMIEMLISDPVGGITKGIVGGMIPSIVSGTLKELDNTVTTLIPNIMAKLAKNAEDPNASPLIKKIGEIFGIKTTKKNGVDLEDRFNKSAAVFDDVTRNTIVEVLPKYARESTSYLRAIAMHLTKKSDSDLLSGAQYFDTKDSTYKTKDQLQKSIANQLEESIAGAFKEVDFGKILSEAGSDLGDKEKASYQKAMNQFFVQLSSFDTINAGDFDLNDRNSAAVKALKSVNGKGRNAAKSKKLLTEAIRYMYDNNVGIDTATLGNIKARNAYSNKVNELEANPELSNILAAGITSDTDLSEFVDKYTGNTQAMKIRQQLKEQAARDARANTMRTQNPRMKASMRASQNISSYVERTADEASTGGFIDRFISDNTINKVKSVGSDAKNSLFAIMKGDTQGALEGFNKMFSDIAGSAWNATKDGFLKPLATKLFGKKDGEGVVSGGLLSGMRNKTSDTIKAIMQKINGKDYTDSEGNVHKVDDMSQTLVGKANSIFSGIAEGINERLFGKKDKEKKDKDKPGVISNMINSLKEGIRGWKEILFGPSDDEDHKKEMEDIKKNIIDALPDALIGTGTGAILGAMSGGSLLGALIGGPVGGAVIGLAGGLLSRSDKFKDWLFGPEEDDGTGEKKRIGGFISKGAQDFLKNNKNTIIGGAALGAMKSIVFPNSAGLLASVVGGPLAGAALGAGFGLIKNSEAFKTFLYGDEESGKRGIINAFKDIFKGKGESEDKDNKGTLKALGMGAIGAAGAGLTAGLIGKVGLMGAMVTPGGPLGAAIVGAAVGIGASSQKFREWIFGKKDEEDGKRKGGLVQKFGNYVQVELLQPMKSKVMDIVEDAKTTLKFDIIENIRAPFVAIADSIKEKVQAGLKKVGDIGKAIFKPFEENVLKPIGSVIDKLIIQPTKKVTSAITGFLYNTAKSVVTAPFKLIGAIYKKMTKKDGILMKGVKGLFNFTKKKIGSLFGFMGKVGLGVLKGIGKGVGFVGGVVKGVASRAKDKFEDRNPGLISKINDFRENRRIAKEDDPNAKSFLQSRQDAKEQRRIDAQNKRDRRNLDKNRRMMAKILGYDEKYFTEETMQKAELAAGKKINWAGTDKNRKFDQTPEQRRAEFLKKNSSQILSNGDKSTDIEVRHLTEEMKTNKKLDQIYKVLAQFKQTYSDMKDDGASDEEIAEFLGNERDQMAQTEKELGLKRINKKNGSSASQLPKDNQELLNEVKNWGDIAVEQVANSRKAASDRVSEAIRKDGIFGSIKGFVKGKIKRSPSKFDEWFNSGTLDDLDDPNLNAKVMDLIADDKHRRAKGGDINKDEPYLVGERGNDLTSAEIIVPNKNGKVLSQQDGGIKVTLTGIGKGAFDSIKNFFKKNKKDKVEKEEETARVNLINANKQTEKSEIQAAEDKGTYATRMLAESKKEEAEKQARRDETQNGILKALLAIGKGNKKHHSIWETIFSKKGLIGAGLMALLPFLWKNKDIIINGISSIASAVGGIASAIGSQFSWTEKNDARDNGNTIGEQIGKEAKRAGNVASDLSKGKIFSATADFVLDDGEYNAQSGSRINYLQNQGRRFLKNKGVKTIGKGIKKVGKTAVKYGKAIGNKIAKPIQGKVAGKVAANEAINYYGLALNPDGSVKLGEDVASVANYADDAAKNQKGIKGLIGKVKNKLIGSSKDDVAGAVSKAAKGKVKTESVEKVAETAGNKMAQKVIQIISGFFDDIAKKCFAKAAEKGVAKTAEKTAKGAIKSLMTKVSKCLYTHFGNISAKISAAFAGKGAAAAATAGLSTVAFCTIGFINGGGKGATARLFQVDQSKVDWKMKLISGAFGAITAGTVTGSVIDIVCGLIADILGVDLLNIFATTLYKAMSSDEKDNALDQAQAEWKNIYSDYQNKELEKNYNVQQKLGNIGSDVTLDQYKEGVKSGKYKATFKGFDDWNADKNKSLGSKIGKGVTKGWKATKSFFTGKTSYKDANGNVYADIGGGQYEAYGADGKKIGVVAKDSVDVSQMEKTTKGGIKNGLKKVGKTISNTAGNIKDKALELGGKAKDKALELGGKAKDGIVNFAKGVGNTVGGFMKQIQNVGSAITNGQKQIEANFNNKDIDFAGYFKANVNTLKEDHPLYGLVSAMLNGSKVVSFIPLVVKGLMKKVGKSVGGFIKNTVGKVTKSMTDINAQQQKLKAIGQSGDVNALNNFQYEPADDNPLAGISKAIVGINRLFMYPSAGIHFAGKKIKGFFDDTVGKVKATAESISPEMQKITALGKSGDLSGLNAYEPKIEDDNPLAGISKGLLKIDKLFHYPTTLLHFAGNKISKGFNSVINKIKKVGKVTGSAYSEMKTFMNEGNVSGLLSYKAAVPEDTPISGFVKGILGIGKYTLVPGTLINKAGISIHKIISGAINKVKDVGKSIKDYVKTLMSYEDPDKDMSGFDKESIGDDSPVGKIIGPMLKGVMKIYVNIKRALNSVGDFIGDKIDGIKDAYGTAKDTVGGAVDAAGSFINNAGTAVMDFVRGGNGGRGGNKSPETVNGYDYYSQNDSNWKSKSYISNKAKDGATMGDSGCGPTAMSMVVSQASKNKVTPTDMADLASRTGFRDETGTNAGFISYAGDSYGLQHQDTFKPSAEYIKQQVDAGNSVVLNGYSKNNSNSAFTNAGHYVVAVGTDSNGNILVNDPRGKEYSKAYSPKDLEKETTESWSFNTGGNGTTKRNIRSMSTGINRGTIRRLKNGGRGVSGDWLSIVKSVKALVAAQHPTYNQGGSMTINYNGRNVTLRPDCSGLVGCMLRIYGAIPEGTNVTSSSLCGKNAIKDGFTWGGWPGWENLKEGDIITRNGHVEIFAYNKDGKHYVYNGGSTNALGSAGATVTGHPQGYTVVWRPGNAGTGANVVGVDGTASMNSTGGTSSKSGASDIMSNVTNLFSQYANAALTGALTGNFDSSQIQWGGTDSSGGTDASSGGTTVASANISGSDVAKNVWNYFTKDAGYSKAATAGLMGNLYQESGMNPANVSGKVAGGLAQWERYDKKTGRWKQLYDYAASKGKDWTDVGAQVEFINRELQGLDNYFSKDIPYGNGISGSTLSNAGAKPTTFAQWKQSNDVDMATRQFEGAFERAGKPMIEKRVAYAKKYYELYGGSGKGRSLGGFGKTNSVSNDKPSITNKQSFTSSLSSRKEMSAKDKISYGIQSNGNLKTSTNDSNVNSKAIKLMEAMVDILRQIGVNTSKLDEISKTGSVTSVNNGKNIVVNTTKQQAPVQKAESRNSKLASEIARGY